MSQFAWLSSWSLGHVTFLSLFRGERFLVLQFRCGRLAADLQAARLRQFGGASQCGALRFFGSYFWRIVFELWTKRGLTHHWSQRRLRWSVYAAGFWLAEVAGAVAQFLVVRRQQAFMKRLLFLLCGLCWIASGIVAGVFGCRFVFAGGGSQTSGLQILAPVSSGGILLGLVHLVGFFALSAFCLLVGMGLCSYSFEPSKR